MQNSINRLYKIRETFYFRVKIPKDLLQFFGGKEDLKRSLRTKSLTQAKRLLKAWDYRTEALFTAMRLGMLSDAQIKQLADDYLHLVLRVDEEYRSGRLLPITKGQLEDEVHRLTQHHEEISRAVTLSFGNHHCDQEQEDHALFIKGKYPANCFY